MTHRFRTRPVQKAAGSSRYFASLGNNWTALLKERTSLRGGEAHLCTLMSRVGESLGLPWLTPVLGSGCLGELTADQRAHLVRRPYEISRALGDSVLGDGSSSRLLMSNLVTSLITSRVPEVRLSDFVWSDNGDQQVRELAAVSNAIQAVSLLQRAHRAALTATGQSVGPTMQFDIGDPDTAAEIRAGLIEPAIECLRRALLDVGEARSNVLRASGTVLDHFVSTLHTASEERMHLSSRDIEVLVEISWLLTIEPVGVYPGWRDLVTSEAVQVDDDDIIGALRAIDVRQPRLRVDSLDSLATVGGRLAGLGEATMASAEAAGGARHEFFDAVAEILKAQSQIRHSFGDLPATAFVTAFDMELEMALARRGADFTVLVPYYYVHQGTGGGIETRRATPLWLATKVKGRHLRFLRRNGDAHSATRPPVEADFNAEWRLAPEMISKEDDSITVVRLVGSPLMPVAKLSDRAFNVDGADDEDDPWDLRQALEDAYEHRDKLGNHHRTAVDLIPALVLDEYSGLQHILASAGNSFPGNLTSDPSGPGFRYWVSVGVQFDDALVRLLAASYLDGTDEGVAVRVRPANRGVMVNRNLSQAEADVMTWQGFDAVRALFRTLTPDLVHYANHLVDENPATSFKPDRCTAVTWPGHIPDAYAKRTGQQ